MIIDPKFGELRSHQAEALELATQIGDGAYRSRIVTAFVTPGGGKSLMSSVFANAILDKKAADLVIVVVPNTALRDQARVSFVNKARNCVRSLEVKLGEFNQETMFAPCGYVVTYHALAHKEGRALRKLLALAKGKRVVLVLDEVHHLCEQPIIDKSEDIDDEERVDAVTGAKWYERVKPLVDVASVVLCMTGTLSRHDRQRIPVIEYDDARMPIVQIDYGRRAALDEKVVLPIDFEMKSGRLVFERYQRVYDITINDPNASKARRRAALNGLLKYPKYTQEIITNAVDHWRAFQQSDYRSRMLVIAHRTEDAESIRDFMAGVLGITAGLATSAHKDPHGVIRKFREKHYDALVTVGMAYEGLDIPDLTHVVFLHNTRSHNWMSQAVERGARFDASCGVPWKGQRCFVFCPDDVEMEQFVSQLRALQVKEWEERKTQEAKRAGHPRGTPHLTLAASALEAAHMSDDGTSVRGDEMRLVERARILIPALRGRPVPEVLRAAALIDWSKTTAAE